MAQGSSTAPAIADVLEARCGEIARRFVDRALAVGASPSLSRDDIIDSLREYVSGLARMLRAGEDGCGMNEIAAVHGRQRFHLGYDVGALVREYGALRELLWDVILESGAELDVRHLRRLFKFVTDDIADAAVQYGSARDAEMRRRTGQHLAFLAHELRNPLASARMALSLIRDRGEVQPSKALEALERGLERVGQLIDDSLAAARLGELATLDYEAVDVAVLLAELTAESAVDAAAKGVAVGFEGGGMLYADVRALRSAVSNLVRNAVKFTHAGGGVLVRARQADGRVLIEVEDACGGLPPGATTKLFDPFVQVGSDRTGFGLGLAIAKQAVDAHGGQLRVHDLPGKGCVFVLDLPERPLAG